LLFTSSSKTVIKAPQVLRYTIKKLKGFFFYAAPFPPQSSLSLFVVSIKETTPEDFNLIKNTNGLQLEKKTPT
jgi:hypothetical protein